MTGTVQDTEKKFSLYPDTPPVFAGYSRRFILRKKGQLNKPEFEEETYERRKAKRRQNNKGYSAGNFGKAESWRDRNREYCRMVRD